MLLGMYSCSKSDGGVSVAAGKMKAAFDKLDVNMNLTTVIKTENVDTVSIIVEGVNSDSTKKLGFMLVNVVNLKPGKYNFGIIDSTKLSFVEAYYSVEGSNDVTYCDGNDSQGSITVITYDTTQFGCSFSFDIHDPLDISMIVKVTGQFNAEFIGGKNGKDLPVPYGKMRARVGEVLFNFNASAGTYTINGLSIISVNGTSSNKESITLQMINLTPEMNKEYSLDTITPGDSSRFTLSYVDSKNESFFADGLNESTGKIKITKIDMKKKNIQGLFQFKGINKNDNARNMIITDGMFSSKLIDYPE
jgi:hypothetical protein